MSTDPNTTVARRPCTTLTHYILWLSSTHSAKCAALIHYATVVLNHLAGSYQNTSFRTQLKNTFFRAFALPSGLCRFVLNSFGYCWRIRLVGACRYRLGLLPGGPSMLLHPQFPIPSVPEDTARVAHAAFRRGNPYLLLRDRLGVVFEDADFADLYPRRGQAAYAPWRLALVTLLQFRGSLSDRQAAEAARARIDWKYLLGLDLTDEGFDHTVLCEFRGRLLEHEATERLLSRVLDVAREGGLLKARGRQRTDSTHVLAAVRQMNRIELLAETLPATLNALATVALDWLRAVVPTDWHERYDRRIEDMRLPATGPKRDAYTILVG